MTSMPERTISTARRDQALKVLGIDAPDIVEVTITVNRIVARRLIRDDKGRFKLDGGHVALTTDTYDFYTP